jgi:hypothetical protein
MTETLLRNKNAHKTKIDYDVNVYVLEDFNSETHESTWNTDQWYLHVYDYNNGDPEEVSQSYLLTKEEAFAMNFENTGDIDAGLDGWMSMDHLMTNYWEQMSDRVKYYLEQFPRYKEDIRSSITLNYI